MVNLPVGDFSDGGYFVSGVFRRGSAMIHPFIYGIIIQNNVAIMKDAASLAKNELNVRVLPMKIVVVGLMETPPDIVSENGDGNTARYVF